MKNCFGIKMPLAYLADPWQKMKVNEEIQVIFFSPRGSVPSFSFQMVKR